MGNRYLALQDERADLQRKRAAITEEGLALFALADAEGRALTEAELAQDDAFTARLAEVDKELAPVAAELARWERQHQRERDAPASQVVTSAGGDGTPDLSGMSAYQKIRWGLEHQPATAGR